MYRSIAKESARVERVLAGVSQGGGRRKAGREDQKLLPRWVAASLNDGVCRNADRSNFKRCGRYGRIPWLYVKRELCFATLTLNALQNRVEKIHSQNTATKTGE